jgi:hypothetical protein
LHLGKLSETVIVHGNAPHDRPGFLVSHLIGNRASFLCTKAPMCRIPETNFLQGITSINGRDAQAVFLPPSPPPAAAKHQRKQIGRSRTRDKGRDRPRSDTTICPVTLYGVSFFTQPMVMAQKSGPAKACD